MCHVLFYIWDNFFLTQKMNIEKSLNIKQWALEDRPREKMIMKGPAALSNAELLAILIGSGTREESAVDLSMKILGIADNNLNQLGKKTIGDLQKLKGIGEAKAITIMAALELGRRRKHEEALERKNISSSKDAFDFFHPLLADLPHEEFWILYLNRANAVIEHTCVSMGGVSGTFIDIKIILRRAIELLASSIVLCHNHPSGNKMASNQDIDITRKIKLAATSIDISVLDHIIIADNLYLSFADEGML